MIIGRSTGLQCSALLILISCFHLCNSTSTICGKTRCTHEQSCITNAKVNGTERRLDRFILHVNVTDQTKGGVAMNLTVFDVVSAMETTVNISKTEYNLTINSRLLLTEIKLEFLGPKPYQKFHYIGISAEQPKQIRWRLSHPILYKSRPLFLSIPPDFNKDSNYLSTECMKTSEVCGNTVGWQIQAHSRPMKTVKCSWDEIESSSLSYGRYCCCEGECLDHNLLSHDTRLPNESAAMQEPSCGAYEENPKETNFPTLAVCFGAMALVLLVGCAVLVAVVLIQQRKLQKLKTDRSNQKAVSHQKQNVAPEPTPSQEEKQQASEVGSLFSQSLYNNENQLEETSPPDAETDELDPEEEKEHDFKDF